VQGPAADDAGQPVHRLFHPQHPQDPVAELSLHADDSRIAVVVRHGQHVQMHQVAGDDLAQTHEPPQGHRLLADLNPRGLLDGLNRRDHVRDRADPADPRDEVSDLVILSADKKALEEPRRLENPQLQKRPAVQLDDQRRLAFHPRQVVHFYFCATAHVLTCPGFHSLAGSPNSVNFL
jgi:hypothetical protein